jgi:hypothetical protein
MSLSEKSDIRTIKEVDSQLFGISVNSVIFRNSQGEIVQGLLDDLHVETCGINYMKTHKCALDFVKNIMMTWYAKELNHRENSFIAYMLGACNGSFLLNDEIMKMALIFIDYKLSEWRRSGGEMAILSNPPSFLGHKLTFEKNEDSQTIPFSLLYSIVWEDVMNFSKGNVRVMEITCTEYNTLFRTFYEKTFDRDYESEYNSETKYWEIFSYPIQPLKPIPSVSLDK